MLRLICLLCACVALAACGYVSTSTLAQLNTLSPLEADPGDIAVALTLPKGVALAEEGAVLAVTARRDGAGQNGETETLSYAAKLAEESRGDTRILRLTEADQAAFRDVQARVRAWKAEGPKRGSGSFSVNATFCALEGAIDPGARVSIAFQTQAGGPFLPLVTDAPIQRLDEIEGALDTIGPC